MGQPVVYSFTTDSANTGCGNGAPGLKLSKYSWPASTNGSLPANATYLRDEMAKYGAQQCTAASTSTSTSTTECKMFNITGVHRPRGALVPNAWATGTYICPAPKPPAT